MKTKPRRKTAASIPLTAFWDTSGILPLCCFQPQSARARQTSRTYACQVVWWVTIKCQDIVDTEKCHDIVDTFSVCQNARGYERSP
jgi:hypothetical protein